MGDNLHEYIGRPQQIMDQDLVFALKLAVYAGCSARNGVYGVKILHTGWCAIYV